MFVQNYSSQLIYSAILIAVCLILRLIFIQLLRRFAKKSERVEHRIGLIIKHIDFAVIFLIILGAIFIWGVDVKNIGVLMSSVFAVIGIALFAQWSILCNITSGVIMFFTFPYKIGDYIKIHDKEFPYEGMIEDIKTFHLILRTKDDEIITYPNSLMLQKGVTVIKPDDIAEYISEEEEIENVKHHSID
ncbi:mechanosensitive ion channel domain-containing protein [Ulvibacter antarcticus]|uniref:Mechanosensitive ion channel-like protein n=1 Tax=Ulvibacter antarcticus TaxID=442714 RepID=A0A3L9YV79_9FLAO|nr:mechanosensitive ion channel domain-containing protein [Ulvibacter antarcticus]RMA64576.1 mechanosensitive ion channel-like protein [Ulvibacter antarcticus]